MVRQRRVRGGNFTRVRKGEEERNYACTSARRRGSSANESPATSLILSRGFRTVINVKGFERERKEMW